MSCEPVSRRIRRCRMTTFGEGRSPRARPPPAVRRRLALGGVAGLVGAAASSSFLLARLLGSTLDPLNSYVSERGVPTQPASGFFRGSDVLAGLLIVLLALVLRDGEIGQVGAVAVIALGLLELPLSLTNHWLGLVDRTCVLCVCWWFAALAILALRTAVRGQADSQANRLQS
jgi:hypothetical protein